MVLRFISFLPASPDERSKEKGKYPYKGGIVNKRDGLGKQLAQGLDNEIHHSMARSYSAGMVKLDVKLAESRIT